MKAVITLLLLACILAVTCGDLVCGTNYCKDHPCTSPIARSSCRSPSTYRTTHSGKCACCPACVTLLEALIGKNECDLYFYNVLCDIGNRKGGSKKFIIINLPSNVTNCGMFGKGERAACKTYSKEIGETPSAVCREPLKCLNGVCTKVALRH